MEIEDYIRNKAKIEEKVRIGYQKLVINGKEWSWNKDNNDLDEKMLANKQAKKPAKKITSKVEDGSELTTRAMKTDTKKGKCWRMGLWNVKGINGKENELITEFEETELDILIVTETKKKRSGCVELNGGPVLLYSGLEEKQWAQSGVGCIIRKERNRNVTEWRAITDKKSHSSLSI